LIDVLEMAAEDAREVDYHPRVLALIIAAKAVVKASRGKMVLEPDEPPESGPLPDNS
jgi:hypothetical protein